MLENGIGERIFFLEFYAKKIQNFVTEVLNSKEK